MTKQYLLEEDDIEISANVPPIINKSEDFPIFYPGQIFGTITPQSINSCIVDNNGGVDILTRTNIEVEEIQNTNKAERTIAQVLSFDNTCVIARVYFESHPSTRKFKKLFVERLKEKNLLYENAYFNIVTKKNEDGSLNIDIEDCDDYSDPEIDSMYETIFKDL